MKPLSDDTATLKQTECPHGVPFVYVGDLTDDGKAGKVAAWCARKGHTTGGTK